MNILNEDEFNMIVPHFEMLESVEVDYYGKTVVRLLVICLPGAVPYSSHKVVPYKYNATILEDGKELEIQPLPFVVNIANISCMTRSGRVFTQVPQTYVDVTKNQS